MKNLILASLLLLLAPVANSQEGEGCLTNVIVTTLTNSKSQYNINITLLKDGKTIGKTEHRLGRCTLNIPTDGQYELEVTTEGYVKRKVEINLVCDKQSQTTVVLVPESMSNINLDDGVNEKEARQIAQHALGKEELSVREGMHGDKPVWNCSYGYTNKIKLEGLPEGKPKAKERMSTTGKKKEPEGDYMVSSGTRSVSIDKVTGQVISNGGYITR